MPVQSRPPRISIRMFCSDDRARAIRQAALVASVYVHDGPAARVSGRFCERRQASPGGWKGADRRHGFLVVRDPRVQPPGAERSRARSGRPYGTCDVRRLDAPAGRQPRAAAAGDHARMRRARISRGLWLGGGRGRDQDGPAVLVCARQKRQESIADDSWRLPRRYLWRDVCLRSGHRHARNVHARAAETFLCRAATKPFRRAADTW